MIEIFNRDAQRHRDRSPATIVPANETATASTNLWRSPITLPATPRLQIRLIARLLLTLIFSAAFAAAAIADREILKNGDLEQADESEDAKPGKTANWTGYRWEGYGQIIPVGAAVKGKRAIMIEGDGPSKQAIQQEVNLPACHYRLTAMVAGKSLRPNQWGQSAAVYISFDAGGDLFQDIFTSSLPEGDSDWRRMELNFEVRKTTKATIYLFNYGGGGFFVDNISLVARKGCRAAGQAFRLATNSTARLSYEPPIKRADLALRGYCADESFANKPLCRPMQSADLARLMKKRATKPLLIADFAGVQPFIKPYPFFKRPWRIVRTPDGGHAARISVGKYMIATPEHGLPSDWSGHDWLTFMVDNPDDKPQKLYVEINDDKSKGYWSRVNYYTMAPPGRSRHKIPLQIFVGEKSVIQQRRRLDLTHITKLGFAAYEARTKVDISNIRLEPEPAYENDFPRLIKLDAGPPTSPLFHGFTALHPGLVYSARRGFGYSTDAVTPRSEDRRHPDNLLRDWTSITKGGLDMDLPNGRYHVWMMLEDPGYWEYYPNFKMRRVMAEGRVVLDEKQTAKQFLKKFYRHADDEDLPGDDIWRRYIKSRYKPLRFTVDVRDGQLNLRFDSDENPYALALSALLIYPDKDKSKGEAFISEMWDRLERQFNEEHRQLSPASDAFPELPGNALGQRLSLFHRSAAIDVGVNNRPAKGELISKLSLSLAHNETAPLTLSLRAHETLNLTEARLDLWGLKTTAFKVRNKLSRVTEDGSVYQNAPRLLDPLRLSAQKPLVLKKHQTRRLWFDIEAPANGKLKQTGGRLRLTFKNGERLDIPVSVIIHPWRLPQADINYGYLGIAPNYPDTPWPQIAQKKQKEMKQAIALLLKHGINSFSGGLGGPIFNGYDHRGRVKLDFTMADASMKLLRGKGKGMVESYLGLAIEGLATDRPDEDAALQYKKPYEQIVRDILKAIRLHGDRQGWRAIRHVVGDEPKDEAEEQSIKAARVFKKAGAKTSIFTDITDEPRYRKRLQFAGLIDMIYLNDHSLSAIKTILQKGGDCALYNRFKRYERGVYLFRLKQLGCKGHMQFAFNSTHVDHWYDLDGRETDAVAVFTHPDGELRQTLELKRYRMAITDYRYLQKLQQAINASRRPKAKGEAKAWLQSLLDKMRVGSQYPSPWSPTRLDAIRRQAAQWINRL